MIGLYKNFICSPPDLPGPQVEHIAYEGLSSPLMENRHAHVTDEIEPDEIGDETVGFSHHFNVATHRALGRHTKKDDRTCESHGRGHH